MHNPASLRILMIGNNLSTLQTQLKDNVLITEDGYRILGPHIPRTIEEIEAVMAGNNA